MSHSVGSASSSLEPKEDDVCPKRFGLNFDPPTIVLEYLEVSTGKLFHRRIGLRRLRPTSDAARVAEKLRQKNQALLAEDRVSFEQIVSLVKRLQESQVSAPHCGDAHSPGASEQGGSPLDSQSINNGVDYHTANLNKLSEEELLQHKAKMDVAFFKNQKKRTDPDFVYDIRVDFDTEQGQPSGWDSDEDGDT